jgi:hypothetical protein
MKRIVLLFLTITGFLTAGYSQSVSGSKDSVRNSEDTRVDAANTSSSSVSTGIQSINRASDIITLYPNPAGYELNVLYDANAGIRNIIVYNMIGKPVTVYKVAGNSARLDIENIPSGIYFIRMVDGQGHVMATRRFTHQ